MRKIIVSFVILFTSLMPCSSIVKALPGDIKKVYVKSFENSTGKISLGMEFMNAFIEEMLKDGRISPVNTEEESDGILTARIERYVLGSLGFTHYEVIIVIDVSFRDKDGVVLWNESNMRGMQLGRRGGLKEARKQIWEKFSRDIIKRTINSFNSIL